MKIVHLSTNDIEPGAARSAYRLNRSLKLIGIDSKMLVQTKQSDDKTIIGSPKKSGIGQAVAGLKLTLDHLPLKLCRNRDTNVTYSIQWMPDNIASQVAKLTPDLINLHWICQGYLQIETLARFNQPIVWTLRDMWAFTGGCHYSGSCDRYISSCGSCPQLHSNRNRDLSRWVWQRKAKAWKDLNITVVALSSWLGKCARSSSLFKDLRVEVIPNGIDTHIYRPINKQVARSLLNLPQNKQLVLFGAVNATSNQRKGFQLLLPALQKLHQAGWQDQIELVVFGSSEPENPVNLGLRTHYLGQLNDALTLAVVYSAANVMLVPSKQEAFGQTALEAIACGTPVVAFAKTGLNDIVDHQQNGYLAQPFEIEDLARGIIWVLESQERYQKLCNWARKKAETEFYLELQARRYISLYHEILESQK